jgi:hypothetical protein
MAQTTARVVRGLQQVLLEQSNVIDTRGVDAPFPRVQTTEAPVAVETLARLKTNATQNHAVPADRWVDTMSKSVRARWSGCGR